MMEYDAINRYGLDHLNIDMNKSYEVYDKAYQHHTIHIYFNKDVWLKCDLCNSKDYVNVGTRKTNVKYASALEDNITLVMHRRVYKCSNCNHYFTERNPFAFNKGRTSLQKEIKILQDLKSETATFTSVAKRYNVSITYVMNLFDKKIDIPRQKFTQVISFDEFYSRKLSRYSYCFVIFSPQLKRILDIIDSRRLDDLNDYFRRIPIEEKNNVKYVSIDLYDTYQIIAKKFFPNAKISADSFHVIKNLNMFFNKIRIKVMNKLSFLKKEKSNYYWLFKKHWRLLLKERTDLNYEPSKTGKMGSHLTPRQTIDYMLSLSQELRLAYELKEEYRTFNSQATILNAAEWLDELIVKFQTSHIDEYIPFWKLLKHWREEIINSFNTINGYRISNGPIERLNRTIKTIIRLSYGSTNFPRMRNRIMYVTNANAGILYERKKVTNAKIGKPRGKYSK